MNIHCFIHVPFEGPGIIEEWAADKGWNLIFTRFFEPYSFPDPDQVDLLVVMGGPMSIYDYHVHPWMEEELEWVETFIRNGNRVLGICLGAQIIASALGGDVYPGRQKEIGWHSLMFLPAVGDFKIWEQHPGTIRAFHWHGDTFDIPPGATRIASSVACQNQAFIFNNRVIALQFHLEVTPDSVKELVDNCRKELVPGTYVQPEKKILGEKKAYGTNRLLMFRLLDYLSSVEKE